MKRRHLYVEKPRGGIGDDLGGSRSIHLSAAGASALGCGAALAVLAALGCAFTLDPLPFALGVAVGAGPMGIVTVITLLGLDPDGGG